MKKTGRTIINWISLVFMLAALAIIIPRIFGIRAFGVLSGSMQPAYPVGSLVYAVPQKQDKIKVGDPITYVMDKSGTVVTHRVIAIDPETGNYTVKGDANNAPDANPVNYKNVVGVVKFHVPLAGYAVGFAITKQGKIIVVTLIAVLLLLMFLLKDDEAQPEQQTKAPPVRHAQPAFLAAAPGMRVYSRSCRYVPRHPAA